MGRLGPQDARKARSFEAACKAMGFELFVRKGVPLARHDRP